MCSLLASEPNLEPKLCNQLDIDLINICVSKHTWESEANNSDAHSRRDQLLLSGMFLWKLTACPPLSPCWPAALPFAVQTTCDKLDMPWAATAFHCFYQNVEAPQHLFQINPLVTFAEMWMKSSPRPWFLKEASAKHRKPLNSWTALDIPGGQWNVLTPASHCCMKACRALKV